MSLSAGAAYLPGLPVDDAGEDQGQARARVHLVVDLAGADAPPLPVVDGPRQGVELLDLEQAASRSSRRRLVPEPRSPAPLAVDVAFARGRRRGGGPGARVASKPGSCDCAPGDQNLCTPRRPGAPARAVATRPAPSGAADLCAYLERGAGWSGAVTDLRRGQAVSPSHRCWDAARPRRPEPVCHPRI